MSHENYGEHEDFRPVQLTVTCLNLRHKLMYVDDRQKLPGLVDEESSTRVYFCTKTQEQLGPDDAPVCPKECTKGRACYRDAGV